ncbi:MAG TPA: putative sulfate/molybdate transporter [Anaerolineae bacterium]|nr:putative sulfate/molybdate transporter [Anaerolineae bacterium]
MKIKSFEFNMGELAGSMGDFGTLFPLAIGYIVVNKLNPAGFLVMMGAANIATGLIYRLPMPIEPMKILAATAIAQHWTPSMIYASAFGMGIVWLLITAVGAMKWLVKVTPMSVVRGVQVALGIMLAIQAYPMITTWWMLGIVSVIIILFIRDNRYAPAAVVLMLLGIVIVFAKGQFNQISPPGFSIPPLTSFSPGEVWQSLLLAGFAQIPLTIGNAIIATAALIKSYWPEREDVTEHKLALNQGVMNVIVPFFGGMPMCHGSGGLAGQYFFGARTGGTNILEGMVEITLGLFFAGSIAALFGAFPAAIIGAMMFLVGVELTKFAKDVRLNKELIPMATTVVLALATNMAVGFFVGIAVYHLMYYLLRKRDAARATV